MHTLTLSGWTQPADALLPHVPDAALFDYSDYVTADAAIAALAAIPSPERVVAWSMGGQLALKAIAAGALAPRELLLIAAPVQFVNDDGFTDGMTPELFAQFHDNYARDTARTVGRFHGLIAKGHANPRGVMEQLAHHPQVEEVGRWLPWLSALGRESLRGVVLPHLPRVTILHGVNDAIVPVAQSAHLHALLPHAKMERWDNTGHAPHLEDRERFASLLAAG